MISEPLIVESVMVPRVWGGDRLVKEFARPSVGEPIGESWEIHGDLQVRGTGRTLDELVLEHGEDLLGRKVTTSGGFPILTKWLDCRSWLSIQVHPDDELAREFTGDQSARGKSEAWYVYRTVPEAELIHGLAPGVEVDQLQGVSGRDILDLLNRQHPSPGQLLYTPAGQVHALGPGSLLYEVQQSCDLTYRFYDWERDRPLHLDRAFDCAKRSVSGHAQVTEKKLSCDFFDMELIDQPTTWSLNGDFFQILVATSSGIELAWTGGAMEMACGQSVLLPAGIGQVSMSGPMTESILRVSAK